jgi:hypothetical protein
MTSDTWLSPLPIKPLGGGRYDLNGEAITTTFLTVANAMAHKGKPLEDPPPPIRLALLNSLKHRFHPDFLDRPPWEPVGDRFHPFRGSIEPLLNHYLWQQVRVIAAPFTLYLPGRGIAGSADAVMSFPDGSIAIATLIHDEPTPYLKQRATVLLGGLIAAAIDTRAFSPGHGMAIWCSCGQTLAESFGPDLCLGRWVETLDYYKAVNRPPRLKQPV